MKRVLVVSALVFAAALSAAGPAAAGGLGVGAGVVKLQHSSDSSLFLTGNLRFKLLGPIALEPEVGYWKESASGALASASSEDFSVGVNGLLVLPARPLELFGGVGIGAHFIDRKAGLAGLTSDASHTKTGLHLLAGLDYVVSDTLDLFGAARRDSFSGEGSDAEPSQTKFYGGLRFKF